MSEVVSEIEILIVDDNATFRKLLRQILEHIGFKNITEADDGSSALKFLESKPIQLVITDWNMHQMSGLELVKKIRENPVWTRVKIIMVTVNNSQKEVTAAIRAGANHYIFKPFEREVILQTIYKVFNS